MATNIYSGWFFLLLLWATYIHTKFQVSSMTQSGVIVTAGQKELTVTPYYIFESEFWKKVENISMVSRLIVKQTLVRLIYIIKSVNLINIDQPK